MSCIWRLNNTLEARFVKHCLGNYLYFLYMFKGKADVKFITFEEFLMHILNFAINDQNFELEQEDAYKVIKEYEKFIASPLVIRDVFDLPDRGPIEDGRELAYFLLSGEEGDLELNIELFYELNKNKSDEKSIKDFEIYKEILSDEILTDETCDSNSIFIKYFDLIRRIRNKNMINPCNIYLKNVDDEVIKKYEQNLREIKDEPENIFNTYEDKFNKLNKNCIDWLFDTFSQNHELELNFNKYTNDNSILVKKQKKTPKLEESE